MLRFPLANRFHSYELSSNENNTIPHETRDKIKLAL
jgi:hypothetical protein